MSVRIASQSKVVQQLCATAIALSKNSYAPYSKFHVGAALLHPDDSITAGCNWENCTYQGTCAERCAIVRANAEGKRLVTAVAVYGRVRDAKIDAGDTSVVSPCGLCRQMLNEVAEISNVDMTVYMVATGQKMVEMKKLSELLPLSFGPRTANLDISEYVPKQASAATPKKAGSAKAAGTKAQAGKRSKK